ncbi:MAG TPA: Cna B-type domain-containing protein, partial [Bacillota bacterium]|nr:Cna B-type domain-containing protein [Bacillota bacterium]
MKARTLTESGRRWLSLLMAVIMCLSLVQLNVTTARADSSGNPAATQKAKQISPGLDGGTVYYTGTGGEGSSENWDVKLTRTLEATGTENLFNVNMEVVTKDGEIEVTNSSAAVSLVLDTSGSMRYCSECGEDYGDYHTYACKYSGKVKTEHSRLTAAKAALVSFLNSYAKDENGNFYDSPRMVSLVTFAGKSQTKKWDLSAASGTQHWVNVNNQAALTYVTNLINGNQITASGGTNTDAGMLYASELLNTTTYGASIGSIDNRFCVLLTDGRPTLYLDSYGNEYGPGNYANVYTTSHAQESCAKVTATGAELYSIAYGLNGATVPVARNGGGQRNVLITDWLGSPQPGDDYQRCGSTAVYDADNAQALIDAFVNILTETNQSSTSTNGVTASIGEFTGEVNNGAYTHIGFFNNENVLVQSFNGASVTGNQIQWDLSQATYVKDEANRTTTYTLSYQVRLNNNIDGFLDWDDSGHAAAAEYNVGNASLKYQYTDAEGNVSTPEVSFPVIKAHGYLGEFDFMKIAHHEDENGDPIFLDGAPFKLSNLLNDALYKPAGTIVQEVTSQTDTEGQTLGLVAFAGIPSGYSYTLSETGEFTSGGRTYEPTDQTWTVAVSYGEVSGIPTENVKNKLKQLPVELELTKNWLVPDAESTTAITVYLKQDGTTEPVATLTLNGSSASSSDETNYPVVYNSEKSTATKWVYTITVPSVNQETGGAYVSSVEEQSLGDGFITTYGTEGLSITNTITGKTSVSVEKEWLPIDGKPMSSKPSVIVTLLANGSATSNTVTLSDANNWFHTFDGLDRYDAQGQVITYTVSEGNGSYQQVSSSGSGTQEDPFVFTNTVMDSTIDVPVSKTWNDADASARSSVVIELLRDGESFRSYTLTSEDVSAAADNVWTHTFEGLPQYKFTRDEDGKIIAVHEYEYTIKEVTNVDGYTSTTDGLNVINTRAQKVSIEVTKIWVDGFANHDAVTIQLWQDGAQTDKSVTLSAANEWTASFDELEQFNDKGVPYEYTVKESPVPQRYTVAYDYGTSNNAVVFNDNHVGNVTVTNTLNTSTDKINVQVTKVWQHPIDSEIPEVTFTLIQKNAEGGVVDEAFDTETLTADDSRTFTFSDLPKYYYEQETDPETGEIVVLELEYQYSVTESEIAGYVNGAGVQDPDNANSWTFTNTITGKITLEVEKVWKALPGTVYPDATIILMRNDGEMDADGNLVWEEVETFTTNSNESKSWTVDKYNENGVEYTYKVVENTVAGYSTSYSPENATYTAEVGTITVTNRLAQSEFDFVASKTWVDNGNAYDTRKDITLTLYQKANDEVSLGTVIVGADGTLSGDGTYDGDVTVAVTDNIWTISFSSLPKYAYDNEGNVYEFTYRVAEDAVEGYTTVIANGKDITNTLKQSETDITIHKTWVDPAETEHPDVTFVLSAQLADGSPVTAVTGYGTFPKTVTLGFSAGATVPKASDAEGAADATVTGDDWYYTWTDLPKYDDNQQLITYTVTEQSVNGYTSTRLDDVPNYFINTIKQATLNFTGEKIWDMSNAGEGDFLNPGAQPVTVALYYVNEDGSLGQMVNMPGLANPVTVDPVEGEGGIKGSFSFNGLLRYNLASGEEYRYAVREVQVTQSTEGEIGYTPVANGGTLELFVSDNDNNFSYKYTVEYGEEPTDDGPYTTVTNTYNDPEAYFYKIIGNYYTYYTDANTLIYQNEGVNLTEGGAYISLSKEERDALANKTITANTDSYTVHNGLDFVFDEDNANNVVSVTLDEVNHMYIIELNYVRHLYKLTVNYVFPEGDKPASGYEDYSDPNGISFGDSDPGYYLGDDSYSGTRKAAPAGFILNKVTVKDSEADAREEGTNYNGGSFANHDVIVTYYYLRDVSPQPVIIDPGFTILKTDDGEVQRAIIHDFATFQIYEDADCENPVEGKSFSTGTTDGKVYIKASELGAGTWYLKEVKAPSGYSPADTVWKIEVTYEASQVYDEDLG